MHVSQPPPRRLGLWSPKIQAPGRAHSGRLCFLGPWFSDTETFKGGQPSLLEGSGFSPPACFQLNR